MRLRTSMRKSMAGSEAFVDTGLWIAAARQPDAQHERARPWVARFSDDG